MIRRLVSAAVVVTGIILICSDAECKYGGAFEENFFGRRPSAAGEALGRGMVALSGDILSSVYNPAGLADAIGLSFCTSVSGASNTLEGADHTFLGAGIPVGTYFGVGLSWYHLDYGTAVHHPGRRNEPSAPQSSIYTLTVAARPVAHFYVGANLNLLRAKFPGQSRSSLWPDLGVMKVFRWGESGNIEHRISLGSSLSNCTGSDIDSPTGREDLPVAFRIGTAYRVSWVHRSWHNRLRTLGLLCHLEYQDVLNWDYRDAYKIGGEVRLLEILALRIGYYYGNIADQDVAVDEYWDGETTYGLGLGLPISRLSRNAPPLRVSFDWVSREEPKQTEGSTDPVRFSIYTLCVDWFF